jgi:plasmid stabilization system protein ParE
VIEYSIRIEPEAQKDLQNIYDFIELNDSEVKASRFLSKLHKSINSLDFMPERCRKSLYIKDEHTRDMIISGYTICYHLRVDIVHIVAVFRQRET